MDLKSAFRQAPAHLRMLIVLRAVAIAALVAILYCFDCIVQVPLPLAPLAALIGLYAVLDVATLLRLRYSAPVGQRELFAQLLGDVAILTAVLYFTGGVSNPLALYYLVLVLYGSMALPPRLVWPLAGASVLSCIALHFFHRDLPLPLSSDMDRTLEHFTQLLMYGFVAVLIAWFGIKLNTLQRAQHEHLRTQAEKDARERYLLGLAALSAGTAHELSTPLSTISVVVGELRDSDSPPPDWKESVDMLWSQIQLCRRSLSAMASAAGVERLGEVQSMPATELLAEAAARLRSLRPEVPLKLSFHIEDNLLLRSDRTLPQALMNFLNNAADASPDSVELRAVQDRLNPVKLVIEVRDRGPGIADELRQRLGKGLVSSKAPGSGHGTGILIAQAAIERFGGSVALSGRRSGGTCVRIELPGFRMNKERQDADARRERIAG
jgi:two-component system, sensor histidine kinase RegB